VDRVAKTARDAAREQVGYDRAYDLALTDPRDTTERARVELTAAEAELATAKEGTRRFAEAYLSVAEKKLELAKVERDAAAAARLAALDPRDELGKADVEITNALAELSGAIQGTAEYDRIRASLNDLWQRRIDLVRTTNQAWRRAWIDPRDRGRIIQDDIKRAMEEVNAAFPESRAQAEAIGRLRSLQLDQQRYEVEKVTSRRLAAVDPRSGRDSLVAQLRNAADEYNLTLAGTPERSQAWERLRAAQHSLSRHDLDYANARRQGAADPQSALQQAQAALDVALRSMNAERRGTLEYEQKQQEYRRAMIELADARAQAASLQRQLNIDLTDPVATAREEARTARSLLANARSRGAAPDVLAQRELDSRNAQARAEAAAFQQRMGDAQTAKDLGRMSHAAYISYLEQEAAQLRAVKDRTRQQTDQLNQVELALKAAKEQIDSQFNIGDIRMPTPYEVRRAVAARAAGLDPAYAANGYPTAVGGGPVTSTSVSNTVLVNGADTAEVTRILRMLLGDQAIGQVTVGSSGARRL
jgi:hypothetical protein